MPIESINFRREIFNSVYVPLLRDRHRYQILMGGAGSGKSVFCAQKVLTHLTSPVKERILLTRKVAKTIRVSQYQLIKDLIYLYNLQDAFDFRDSTLSLTCQNGNELISIGMDNSEKIKSIQGITKVWLEEATEFSEKDFTQIDLRLRGRIKGFFQLMLSFNPIDEHHWLNTNFFRERTPNSVTLKTTYKHNRFLDPYFKEVLENIRDENLRNIYLLGMWGVLKNIIYSPFRMVDDFPAWDWFEEVICGLDFGFNNPMGMVAIGVRDQTYRVKELLYRSGMTIGDLIDEFKRLGIPKSWRIYCDSASPEQIESLTRAGYNALPAFKDVRMGIDLVKGLNDTGALLSYAGNANLHKERQSYKWEEDKNGRVMDRPVKYNDHLMDALRYAIASYLRKIGAIGIVGWKKK